MINLFVNYYQAKDEERQKEIDFCFDKNLENPLINKMIVFSSHVKADATRTIKIDRPTYQDFFNATKDYPNDINIICNSDIFFDQTLEHVNRIKDNEVFCLTRWEWNDGNVIDFNRMHGAPPEWSGDAWITKGAFKLNDCDQVIAINQLTSNYATIPFTLGLPGCDNHIAWKFRQAGYAVLNPSLSVRAIHVHKERSRDYGHHYRVTGSKTGGTWGQLLKVNQTR